MPWRGVLGTFKQQQEGLWLELIEGDEVLVKTMVNSSSNVIYSTNHLKIILNHALLPIPQFWLIFSPMLTSLVANVSSMPFPV